MTDDGKAPFKIREHKPWCKGSLWTVYKASRQCALRFANDLIKSELNRSGGHLTIWNLEDKTCQFDNLTDNLCACLRLQSVISFIYLFDPLASMLSPEEPCVFWTQFQSSSRKELLCTESCWWWIWKQPHCLRDRLQGPLGISSATTVTSPELNREILFSSDILTVTNILLQLGPQ